MRKVRRCENWQATAKEMLKVDSVFSVSQIARIRFLGLDLFHFWAINPRQKND
jgi:hypothetical protein